MTEQMLPSSVNYLDTLPRAIPSERVRRKFYSSNGRSFGPNQTIKIDIESPKAFLDPSNCFLEFDFTNTSGGLTCALDLGGSYGFVKNFRIHQGGTEILRLTNLNRLMSAVLVPGGTNLSSKANSSITGQQRYNNDVGAGVLNTPEAANATGGDLMFGTQLGSDTDIGNNATVKLTMPLVGGLFSQTGTQKLLPLPLLNKPIELYFDLAPLAEPLCFSAGAPTAWTIDNVSVVADLVEVPRDVVGFMRELQFNNGGSLALQGQNYEYNAGVLPAASSGNVVLNIPSRKRSIKGIFFAGSSRNYGVGGVVPETQCFSLSYSGAMCVSSYFLRAGALVMPQPAVQCAGNTNVAGNAEYKKAEQFLEFKKAMGHLGHGVGTGLLSTISYGNRDGDNSDGGGGQQSPASDDLFDASPFGLDLDAYQNEAIRAGLDTQTLSLEMALNLTIEDDGGGATFTEDQQVDIFSLYDIQYYINSDGSITYED